MRNAAMANRAQTSPPLRRAIPAKHSAKATRGQFHSDRRGDVKLASASLVLRRTPGAQRAEHHRNQQNAATANDHRQHNGENGAAGIGLVGAG